MKISVSVDNRALRAIVDKTKGASSAAKRAGSTAVRDMRSEAKKRITKRKRIKGKYVSKALRVTKPKTAELGSMEWAVVISGHPVPLVAYPHRQTKKGVSVEVNRGKRTLIPGAFIARMKSGHQGVYLRKGKARLPIQERLGSRPVDALLHPGEKEAVAERGQRVFSETFQRLMKL